MPLSRLAPAVIPLKNGNGKYVRIGHNSYTPNSYKLVLQAAVSFGTLVARFISFYTTIIKMKVPYLFLLAVLLIAFAAPKKHRVLVFSKTTGFRHSSIPAGKAAILLLGKQKGFIVDTTEDASLFTTNNLKKYSAVVFLSTTGNNFLDSAQKAAFQNYIRRGGGYVGVHGATDAEYNWAWYGKLSGARFLGHPEQQVAKVNVVNAKHPSTKGLPRVWERKDEWYNFKDLNPDVHVLLTLDEGSYKGGTHGGNHPVAWYHNFDGGRGLLYRAGSYR
jgi:type 1 glutamine amidotransferase